MAATMNTDFVMDSFKNMTETFADTMKTAMKFNEETARFWADTFTKNTEEFRNRTQKVADEFAPFTKNNVERVQKTFEEQMNRTTTLFRDTFKAMTPNGQANNMTERMTGMWKDSFETVRESMDTVAKANMDMFKNWNEFFQNNMFNAARTNGAKPATKNN